MANAAQPTNPGQAGATADAESEKSEIEKLKKAIEQLQQLKAHLQKDKYANLTLDILSTIVDDLCVDVCVEVHRSLKMDLLYVPTGDVDPSNRVVDMPGYDIHGQVPEKVPKSEHFNCDHCGTKVGASKYAAHLAKCMGHGGRQRRARDGGGDTGASNPYLSTSPSHPRPVPSPPPAASGNSAHSSSPVGFPKRAVSPSKRAVSPSRPRATSPARVSPSKRAVSPGKADGETPGKRARSTDGMEEG